MPSNPNTEAVAFGLLLHTLLPSGEDLVPAKDLEDFARGAQRIPMEVTEARRLGDEVAFVTTVDDWYWVMPDGRRISHDS